MASMEEDGSVEEKDNNNKKRTKSAIAVAWLTFYNIAMTAGWLVLAMAMMRFYLQKATHKGLYKSIARTLKFFQTVALVEVSFWDIGIVRTSVIVTGVQVCSRIFMVWFITNSIKQIQYVYHHVPSRSGRRTPDYLRCSAVRSQNRNVVHEAPQQVQHLLRLLLLPHHRHALLHPIVPTALFPHAPSEEKGASWGDHSGEG
ncbi:very-long-chain (3R)-3-hydroxyacyl-CoA dehydratase 1-like isoform X3 [Oncorhynchus clarkii lewisi]|uniref:very-long-chain (3R)-3-hydroxyacyl-CoA dehydratase 1-like isoform X3 n=1 Tax=Oncorhynchus clarkii lewisi TaxID=490388 RepID=UPI0039B99E29